MLDILYQLKWLNKTMNFWMKSHQSRSVSCTLFLDRSINHIKAAMPLQCSVLCILVSWVLPFCLVVEGWTLLYTLLLYVYLIIVLLFYYYLDLSLFYLGLKEKLSILLSGFVSLFFFFFQVLNSNYSAKSISIRKFQCYSILQF